MRTILHIDMDAFFAAVEVLANPGLAGKPVIVCGDPERRSVVSTASYEARKHGVHSGMPVTEARRLCPNGVYVRGNPEKYIYMSVQILNLLKTCTDKVEPFSIDEAFLDLTESMRAGGGAEHIARNIKELIRRRLGLTCSVGIAPNKLVAKMASSLEKPDGCSLVPPGSFLKVFGRKPVSKLWGVGDKTEKVLNRMGIRTIEDLSHHPVRPLVRTFGVEGEYLHYAANGVDDTPVVPYYDGIDAKSVGHEHTLFRDVGNRSFLEGVLLRLSDQVARRMRNHGHLGRTITIKIRYSNFKTYTRQRALHVFTDEERTIFGIARSLFRDHWSGDRVRLLGVSVSDLISMRERSQVMLFDEDRKYRDLLDVMDRVKDTFGEDALTRARLVR